MTIPQDLVDIAARVHEAVSSDFSEPPPDPMRAALEAYEAALWQPIETAPGQQEVLVCRSGLLGWHDVAICTALGEWCVANRGLDRVQYQPTHWTHLLTPPPGPKASP